MKKIVSVLTLFFLVSLLVLYVLPGKEKFGDGFFEVVGIDTFEVSDRFKPNFSSYNEESIYAHNGADILQLTVLSNTTKQNFEKYKATQFFLFEGLYDQKLPPYPEFITSGTGCAEEFLPKKYDTKFGSYYVTYAGARFNYGVCDESTATYKAGVGIFYCESSKKVFKLSYLLDKKSNFDIIMRLFNSFQCINI